MGPGEALRGSPTGDSYVCVEGRSVRNERLRSLLAASSPGGGGSSNIGLVFRVSGYSIYVQHDLLLRRCAHTLRDKLDQPSAAL